MRPCAVGLPFPQGSIDKAGTADGETTTAASTANDRIAWLGPAAGADLPARPRPHRRGRPDPPVDGEPGQRCRARPIADAPAVARRRSAVAVHPALTARKARRIPLPAANPGLGRAFRARPMRRRPGEGSRPAFGPGSPCSWRRSRGGSSSQALRAALPSAQRSASGMSWPPPVPEMLLPPESAGTSPVGSRSCSRSSHRCAGVDTQPTNAHEPAVPGRTRAEAPQGGAARFGAEKGRTVELLAR